MTRPCASARAAPRDAGAAGVGCSTLRSRAEAMLGGVLTRRLHARQRGHARLAALREDLARAHPGPLLPEGGERIARGSAAGRDDPEADRERAEDPEDPRRRVEPALTPRM